MGTVSHAVALFLYASASAKLVERTAKTTLAHTIHKPAENCEEK